MLSAIQQRMECEIIPVAHIPSNTIKSASIHLAWASVSLSIEQSNWKKAEYYAGRKALSIATSSCGIDAKELELMKKGQGN